MSILSKNTIMGKKLPCWLSERMWQEKVRRWFDATSKGRIKQPRGHSMRPISHGLPAPGLRKRQWMRNVTGTYVSTRGQVLAKAITFQWFLNKEALKMSYNTISGAFSLYVFFFSLTYYWILVGAYRGSSSPYINIYVRTLMYTFTFLQTINDHANWI